MMEEVAQRECTTRWGGSIKTAKEKGKGKSDTWQNMMGLVIREHGDKRNGKIRSTVR